MSDDELLHALRNSKGWPTLGNAAADRIEELKAENARLRQAQAWQPIETAPRDGEILGFWPGGCTVIQWFVPSYCWVDEAGDITGIFTHWMPLPEPPQDTDK